MKMQKTKSKKNIKIFIGMILLIIPLIFSIYSFVTRLDVFKILTKKGDSNKKLTQASNSLNQQAQAKDQQDSSLFVSCGGFIE